MTTAGRRLLRPILGLRDPARRLGALICCVLVSAGLTSLIGLHVVFGALLCGLVTPRSESGQPDSALLTPMRHLAMALLPVFFVTAGMNVRADRVSPVVLISRAAAVTVAAVSKLVCGWCGARWAGMTNEQALSVGVLMNTRGLTEVVAINVGLATGLITTQLYIVFVGMALATTAMTMPLLNALERRHDRPAATAYTDMPECQFSGVSGELNVQNKAT